MTDKAVFANEISRKRPPKWLPADAKSMWKQITRANPPDWFRDSDLPLLESYCVSYSQMRAALATLETDGEYTCNAAGTTVAHPAMKVAHDAMHRMGSLATKLRICPNARHSDNRATSAKPNRALANTEAGNSNVRKMFGS